jgi:DtxR family Mn-dependent transcriptional regulator
MRRKKSEFYCRPKPLSASLEDYLEAIYNLSNKSQVAHSKDIAASLGVAKPSVTGALRLLVKKGLVNYVPYGSVTLTKAGRAQAAKVAKKHDILESFFMNILGVDHSVAHPTACKAEHVLGEEAVKKLLLFIEFTAQENSNGSDTALKFKEYCRRKAEL